MSIMQLEEPLELTAEFEFRVIELIPPALTGQHGRPYEGFSHVKNWNTSS